MGHIGFTPQTANKLNGIVQGKDIKSASKLVKQAISLEKEKIFSLVLECAPIDLAKFITNKINIPTIGIGAGRFCDGQVLVLHDLLGLVKDFKPKFVRRFANIYNNSLNAIKNYIKNVKDMSFPNDNESYHIDQKIIKKLQDKFDGR